MQMLESFCKLDWDLSNSAGNGHRVLGPDAVDPVLVRAKATSPVTSPEPKPSRPASSSKPKSLPALTVASTATAAPRETNGAAVLPTPTAVGETSSPAIRVRVVASSHPKPADFAFSSVIRDSVGNGDVLVVAADHVVKFFQVHVRLPVGTVLHHFFFRLHFLLST